MLLLFVAQMGLGSFLVKTIIMAAVLLGAAYLLDGVKVEDFTRAVIVAVVLSFLNATLGGFLDFITTPLRWITLGFFSLVVDAVVLMSTAYFLKGFTIKNFSWALLLAAFVAVANLLLHMA